jgi:hypothetical protein
MHIEEKFERTLTAKIKAVIEQEGDTAYEIGAWEAFNSSTSGSKNFGYKFLWIGLAASFLMAMSLNSLHTIYNEGHPENQEFATRKSNIMNSALTLSAGEENRFSNSEEKVLHLISTQIEENTGNILQAEGTSTFALADVDEKFAMPGIGEFKNLSTSNSFKYSPSFVSMDSHKRFDCPLTKGLKLGFQTTPLMSVSKNKNGFGWSAGVIAEIPFMKNLSLTSGLLINHQNVTYSESGFSESKIKSKMRLLAVELPLNIKYNIFKRKKKEVSVTAGVSSIAYVKQEYSDGTTNETKGFEGVDGVKYANMAMSVEFPVDKRLSVLVEPFVKMPLGSSTPKDIKVANTGVNVRLNYSLARLN